MRKDLITAVSALALLAGPALAQDPTATSRPFDTGVVEQYRTTPVVGNLMADDVIGMEVFGAGGEEIGNVDDIVIDPQSGEPIHLIVAYGGFLGLGERRIAVDWNQIQPMPGEDGVMLTGVTEEMLEGYQAYEPTDTDVSYRGMIATEEAAPATTTPGATAATGVAGAPIVVPEDTASAAPTAGEAAEQEAQAAQAAQTAAAAGVTPVENVDEQAQVLGQLRADQLIGMEVFGEDGEEIGNVQDFLMDPQSGQPTQLIVAYGGFLGLGERQIAVDWNQIQPMPGEDGIMLAGVTQEMLDELEAYEPAEGAVTFRGQQETTVPADQQAGAAAEPVEGDAAVVVVAPEDQQQTQAVQTQDQQQTGGQQQADVQVVTPDQQQGQTGQQQGQQQATQMQQGQDQQGQAQAGQDQQANVVVVAPEDQQQTQGQPQALQQPQTQATEAMAAQPGDQQAVVIEPPRGFDPGTPVLGQLRADQIMGTEVFGAGGEEIGNVADLIVDPQSGEMTHVIVASGGFLGLGERRFAVEWANIQPMPQEEGIMLTNITAADVEGLEEYEEPEGTLAYSRFPADLRRPTGTAPGTMAAGQQADVQVVTPEQQQQGQAQQQADVQVVTPEQQGQAGQQQQAQTGQQQQQQAQAGQQQAAGGEQMVGLSFEEIMGREVVGADGEVIGQVSDVLLDEQGQATDVVISAGGVLGLGDKEVALPLQELALIEGQDRLQATNVTSAQVEEMEAFEYGEATLSYERRNQ